MARKLITSYQRAVELSEKAALEQQVASSFIKHWEDVLVAVDAEFNAITDAQKEQIVHVFEAVSHFWKNENIVGGPYPGDRTKVADYLYGRSRKKGSWLLADAVPQYLWDIPVISDAEFQTRYNLSERLALIKQLNEVKGRQTNDGFFNFKGYSTSWDKERLIASLEHQINVNWTICKLIENGGVDQVRQEYIRLFFRHGVAFHKRNAAKARDKAERDARRLLAGRGRKK